MDPHAERVKRDMRTLYDTEERKDTNYVRWP